MHCNNTLALPADIGRYRQNAMVAGFAEHFKRMLELSNLPIKGLIMQGSKANF